VLPVDAALDTLLYPFAEGKLAWPEQGKVLFLRARAGSALKAAVHPHLACEQSFKPYADVLTAAGFAVAEATSAATFPLVMLLSPRQREESRALLARALQRTAAGGIVVAAAMNTEGARSAESDLEQLAGSVQSLSKNKCRVFWAGVDVNTDAARNNAALIEEWAAIDAPRPIGDGRFLSRPGLFAWDRIDAASALLVSHLPADLAGRGADLGAGYGYLSAEILARYPRVTALDLYEAEARALDLARRNLPATTNDAALGFHWHDVTRGLSARYDFIVTNPPFHQGRADLPQIGRAFIVAAAAALQPGGRFWLVANRHLPYEAELAKHFKRVHCVVEAKGFKVMEAVKGKK
jgi:16S rRNA (guanine1207-N2)-methyltransferase